MLRPAVMNSNPRSRNCSAPLLLDYLLLLALADVRASDPWEVSLQGHSAPVICTFPVVMAPMEDEHDTLTVEYIFPIPPNPGDQCDRLTYVPPPNDNGVTGVSSG